MTAHANETATRAAYEAFAAGDLDAIRAFFTDDVTWHQGGADALSGDYHGIDAVIGLLTKQFELTDGKVGAELVDVYATDTRTVAVEHLTATRNGATIDTVIPLVFDGTDGRAHTVWSYVFAEPADYAAFWGSPET